MRVLLDECLPYDLIPLLQGHEVHPVARLGWAGTKNGVLLRRAVEAGFAVLLTIDKRLSQQQAIPADIALVTLRARSNRMPDLEPLVPATLPAFRVPCPDGWCAWVPNHCMQPTRAPGSCVLLAFDRRPCS